MRVLIIEDDVEIAEQLALALKRERMDVDVASNGVSGLKAASVGQYGLAILDIMLPGKDGWEVCRELRAKKSQIPILMLTARDSVDDRIKGLESGADDYLAKPFDVRELIARVRALLRRDKVIRTGVIQVGDLTIDTQAQLVERAGKEIHLTPREYSLLEALARNAGRTLTREIILDSIWNSEENSDNSVNFHVTSLRKKIDAPSQDKLIHTVHGFGYVLKGPE